LPAGKKISEKKTGEVKVFIIDNVNRLVLNNPAMVAALKNIPRDMVENGLFITVFVFSERQAPI